MRNLKEIENFEQKRSGGARIRKNSANLSVGMKTPSENAQKAKNVRISPKVLRMNFLVVADKDFRARSHQPQDHSTRSNISTIHLLDYTAKASFTFVQRR